MKRILYLIGALAAITLGYLLLRKNINTTAAAGLRDFAISKPEAVDRIFFSLTGTQKFVLMEKDKEGNWTVQGPDKKPLPADPANIDMLLNFVMKKLEVKFPVSDSAVEPISRLLYLKATKAEFYLNGKLHKTIFVGGPTPNSLGTYMFMKEVDRPCVMHVPGFDGYLTPYFSVNLSDWRSKSVMQVQPEKVKTVQVNWAETPEMGWKIVRNSDQDIKLFDISGHELNAPRNLLRATTAMMEDIRMEGVPNISKARIDTVLRGKPFYSLMVEDVGGAKHSIELFRIPVSNETYSPEDRDGNARLFEIEYFWARIDGRPELVQMQDAVMRNRMKRITDFQAQH
jgi:hypothetical protein